MWQLNPQQMQFQGQSRSILCSMKIAGIPDELAAASWQHRSTEWYQFLSYWEVSCKKKFISPNLIAQVIWWP